MKSEEEEKRTLMYHKIMNHTLVKMFLKLPLWAKVVAPAAVFVMIVALFNVLGTVIKVGIVVLIIIAVLTVVNRISGKKDEDDE